MELARREAATGREAATRLVLGPALSISEARTAGVALFERTPPMHSVLLARGLVDVGGRTLTSTDTLAIPAGTRHRIHAMIGEHGCVAYFDARHYAFAEVARVAARWRGFVPGRDDIREAFGDATRAPRRRLDRRIERALASLEGEGATVAAAAAQVGLSASRLAHVVTAALGSSPRAYRTWFLLRRALGAALLGGANLTEAAHAAGFADSAHLTRTCKQLMGVRPAQMLPPTIYVAR